MPHSSGCAHPVNDGELRKGSGIDPVRAQHSEASVEAPEVAHSSQIGNSDTARLQTSIGQQVFVRELENEDEDDQESVVDFPVVDKTFNRLVNYIYEQYPDSRLHSDPSGPPRCDFESYFAVADPQAIGRPRMRWYPRVQEITAKTHERALKVARES